jgi:hypothetical protein
VPSPVSTSSAAAEGRRPTECTPRRPDVARQSATG